MTLEQIKQAITKLTDDEKTQIIESILRTKDKFDRGSVFPKDVCRKCLHQKSSDGMCWLCFESGD